MSHKDSGNSSVSSGFEDMPKKKLTMWQRVKDEIKPDMNFLPLKMTWFFFTASTFALIPYLTIHMKDIGISVEHIAVMYAVLPFTIFVAPPLIGFLADILGSYTKVVLLTIVASAVFHTALLFVPTSLIVKYSPEDIKFTMSNQQASLSWSPCLQSIETDPFCDEVGDETLGELIQNNSLVNSFQLNNCNLDCSQTEGDICDSLNSFGNCQTNLNGTSIEMKEVTLVANNQSKCQKYLHHNIISKGIPLTIKPGCHLSCSVIDQKMEIVKCSKTDGNRLVTNIVYFILRSLATMGLGCNYVLLDAQTIQMVKVEEGLGRKGSLGRQFVFQCLAQAIVSPIVGKLMDLISKDGEAPNYLFPFLIGDVFLALTFAMILCIKMDLSLPKSEGMKGIKKIFTSLEICVFLFVMFILGNCFGFVETFLFVYLKDELGAPMYLLGLTVTSGALVSIPFLFIADEIVIKVGQTNVFITALLTYAVRYVGYSHITNPWLSFPFEALELFTLQLMKVAMLQYIGDNAPKGLLATLNGLAGCLHYSVGRGTGGLIGGAIVAITGSLATAFRYFGVGAGVAGLLYFIYEYFYIGGFRTLWQTKKSDVEDSQEDAIESKVPLVEDKPSVVDENQSKNLA